MAMDITELISCIRVVASGNALKRNQLVWWQILEDWTEKSVELDNGSSKGVSRGRGNLAGMGLRGNVSQILERNCKCSTTKTLITK
jgi:hypothetical protein